MLDEIDISIVIPAFNEEKRLPTFLQQVIMFCIARSETFEIIVVDDGSHDDTIRVAESYRAHFSGLRVLCNRKNRGKGYAVKRGLLKARGKICLFMDADGSVLPNEIQKNLHYITADGYDIFVGSRVLKEKGQSLNVRWYRKIPGTIFNFLVRILLFKEVQDTQCGFKLFRREVIKPLFSRCHLRGFGFDIEILYLAYKMGYGVKEGPVSWQHVKGSKFNFFTDPLGMFFSILQVKSWHCTLNQPFL